MLRGSAISSLFVFDVRDLLSACVTSASYIIYIILSKIQIVAFGVKDFLFFLRDFLPIPSLDRSPHLSFSFFIFLLNHDHHKNKALSNGALAFLSLSFYATGAIICHCAIITLQCNMV